MVYFDAVTTLLIVLYFNSQEQNVNKTGASLIGNYSTNKIELSQKKKTRS